MKIGYLQVGGKGARKGQAVTCLMPGVSTYGVPYSKAVC